MKNKLSIAILMAATLCLPWAAYARKHCSFKVETTNVSDKTLHVIFAKDADSLIDQEVAPNETVTFDFENLSTPNHHYHCPPKTWQATINENAILSSYENNSNSFGNYIAPEYQTYYKDFVDVIENLYTLSISTDADNTDTNMAE